MPNTASDSVSQEPENKELPKTPYEELKAKLEATLIHSLEQNPLKTKEDREREINDLLRRHYPEIIRIVGEAGKVYHFRELEKHLRKIAKREVKAILKVYHDVYMRILSDEKLGISDPYLLDPEEASDNL